MAQQCDSPITSPLLPRGRAKIKARSDKGGGLNPARIPDTWAEFARRTKIRSGTKVIPFDPFWYQEKLVETVENNYGTIVVKGRQLGCTETMASYMLWRAAREPGFLGVVLSKGFADTSNIAKRIRAMADSAPDMINLQTKNLTDLVLEGGGRILFRPSTPNGVRGLESVSMLVFDEAAFVPSIDLLFTAAIPSTEMCGEDARIVLMSTPWGRSGFFFERLNSNNGNLDILEEAEKVRSVGSDGWRCWIDTAGWAKVLIHWRAHPIYSSDPNYIDTIKTRKQLTDTTARQEYDLEFESSEQNVFPAEYVRRCSNGNYEEPRSDGTYYIGVDTSTTGADYTVALVGRYERGCVHIVEMYRKRRMTLDYNLLKIGELIRTYNPLVVGIERNGCGQVYLEQLTKTNPGTRIEGLVTTKESKSEMITRILYALEQEAVSYPPSVIVDELMAYRRDGIKLEAPPGMHDDTVMSLAFVLSVSPVKRRIGTYDLSF